MSEKPTPEPPDAQEVTVTRLFSAPRELVWRAWTEPSAFSYWFSTPPFTTPESGVALDVKPGGEWRATQVSDDGTELPFIGVYREVVPPERLVLTFQNPADRSDPDVELATVMLESVPDGTRMTFRQQGHLPPEQYVLLKQGYSRFFDRLEQYLAGV